MLYFCTIITIINIIPVLIRSGHDENKILPKFLNPEPCINTNLLNFCLTLICASARDISIIMVLSAIARMRIHACMHASLPPVHPSVDGII